MPAQNLPAVYPLVVLLALGIATVGMLQVSTIEGRAFSWFVRAGSLTALGLGLLLLAQALATWTTARSHLKRLARSPIEPHFHEVAPHVPWEISLAPPRLTELMPVARMADGLIRDFRALSLPGSHVRDGQESRRGLADISPFRREAEWCLGLREDDLADVGPLFAPPSHTERLGAEMATRQHAALIQSASWFEMWRLSDAIVGLMERTYWRRVKADVRPDLVAAGAGAAALAGPAYREFSPGRLDRLETLMGDAYGHGESATASDASRDGWLARGEQLVALQMAFVMRDIVARTITCLFAAMACLTCLTAAHLLYSFNGRASMLMIDLLAVAGAALSAVWILVDMERDQVLSRLRDTTPGRVDINWDFIRRMLVYGVLPLLVVLGSLFPEVGGTLFGWLEPLRKLSAF